MIWYIQMKRLIRPQDLLLLTLAGLGDIFEEIRDPLMMMGKAYERMYGFIPNRYKRHNFLKNVTRSLKTGYIEKVEKNGEVYLRLTPRGDKKVHRDFSLLSLAKRRWDRKWRVVFFDIEEISRKVRSRLRAKLKELGFGMLQKSVWVTPHDIGADFYEFLKTAGLEDWVFVIEGRTLFGGEAKSLAQKIWHLEELNAKYLNLEQEINNAKQLTTRLSDRTKKWEAELKNGSRLRYEARLEQLKRKIKMSYLQVLLADPHLPKELLPDSWAGERARLGVSQLSKRSN